MRTLGPRSFSDTTDSRIALRECWKFSLNALVGRVPTASDDLYGVVDGTTLDVAAPGVLANDSDPDAGDTLTAVLVGDVAEGVLTLNPDGSFTYEPGAGFTDLDSFTYMASDGQDNSNVATVTITPANLRPTANNDRYSVARGATLVVAAPGVLGNDSDPDAGDTLTAVLVSGAAEGVLTLSPDGSFTYEPAAGFAGEDSFTYKASDGEDYSWTATVTITLEAEVEPQDDTGCVPLGRLHRDSLHGLLASLFTAALACMLLRRPRRCPLS